MEVFDAVLTRRSIRKFTDQPIDDETVHTLLTAAMAGPSAVNARPWSFLVVRDRETLARMAEANGRTATPLKEAALGVLVCGDLERAFERAPDYWIIDGAIAAQNMLLTAHSLGLGAVWLGTWPQEDKMERQRELLGLPDTVVPHSLLAFGYPAEDRSAVPHKDYEESQVHWEHW